MTAQRELELVESHREGDPDAMGELLQSYQRRVFTICFRMLRDVEEASDLTQDALVKVIENLEKYDGRAKLSTWVIRITMNCCISHLRKKKVRKHGSLDAMRRDDAAFDDTAASEHSASQDNEAAVVFSGELSGPKRVERDELHAGLDLAMRSLDPDMRSVLVLRDMQGLEYEQMAQALDVPVGTVKSRLFRARTALRNALDRFSSG